MEAAAWQGGWGYERGRGSLPQAVRDQFHIICEGHHIPPAITNFHDMKFPKPILDELDGKGIVKPTPIQARGSVWHFYPPPTGACLPLTMHSATLSFVGLKYRCCAVHLCCCHGEVPER